MSSGSTSYQINELAVAVPAIIADGSYIQTVTSANCPAARTRAVDARDNHTYWVQKLADGKCWMLTNLAYAGGGDNTYGDVDSLTDGAALATSYTAPYYYIVPSTTNYTTEPTTPSSATNGIGQYGYLYNWCGAMGGQATSGCANATTPAPDPKISVCPAGWRLPSSSVGEFVALNNAINGGATNSHTGLLNTWLVQYGGIWANSFGSQNTYNAYWSSTQLNAAGTYGLAMNANISSVAISATFTKYYGQSVRCLAN